MTTSATAPRTGSLSRKIIVMVLAILVVSCVLFCTISIISSREGIRNSIQQRMLDIANCAAGSVDGDVLETLTADDAGTPGYQAVYDALAVFHDNVELAYVYGVRAEADGTFTFTVDPDPVDPGAFGDPIVTTDGVRRAATGVASVDYEPYTDSWGTFVSAYSPVFDSKGDLAGIVAVDFTIEWFEAQLSQRTYATIMASLAVLSVTLVVAAVLSYAIVRPFALRQQQLTLEVEERAEEYARLYQQLLRTLADAVDARDPHAVGHSRRVSAYAQLMGAAMGYDEAQVADLGQAALLHDIGNISVPDSILTTPSPLTEVETDIMRTHAETGAAMLRDLGGSEAAAEVAHHHHERWDGAGYPEGLAGEAIPAWARIVAACGAFDAMGSARAWRSELSDDEIRAELEHGRGTQFDPAVVDALVRLWEAGALDAVRAEVATEAPRGTEGPTTLLQEVVGAFASQSTAEEVDVTTGVLARAAGESLIAEALKQRPGVLVFLDVDNLKQVNDTFGHDAGDRALRLVGEALRTISDGTLACRVGGDEFLVFMEGASPDEAVGHVRQIMAAFSAGKANDRTLAPSSVSAGLVACVPPTSFADARAKADKALYRVKHTGKNDLAVFGVEDGEPTGPVSLGAVTSRRRVHPSTRVLFTLAPAPGAERAPGDLERDMDALEVSVRSVIRSGDACSRQDAAQVALTLVGTGATGAVAAIGRILCAFASADVTGTSTPTYLVAGVEA